MLCEPKGQSYTCVCEAGYQQQSDPSVPIKFHCVRAPQQPQQPQYPEQQPAIERPIGPGFCSSHTECHKWGECVFAENGLGKCKCRGWYVGDGVTHCGPPEDQQPPPQPQQPQQPTYEHSPSQTVGAICRSHEECSEFGQCVYSNDLGHYKCECRPPYKGDGIQCAQEVQGGCF